MPRELGASSRFHNPVTPGTTGQSQIDPRRDRFELADAFLEIRDLDARARIGQGPVTLGLVPGGEFLVLELEPAAPAGQAGIRQLRDRRAAGGGQGERESTRLN